MLAREDNLPKKNTTTSVLTELRALYATTLLYTAFEKKLKLQEYVDSQMNEEITDDAKDRIMRSFQSAITAAGEHRPDPTDHSAGQLRKIHGEINTAAKQMVSVVDSCIADACRNRKPTREEMKRELRRAREQEETAAQEARLGSLSSWDEQLAYRHIIETLPRLKKSILEIGNSNPVYHACADIYLNLQQTESEFRKNTTAFADFYGKFASISNTGIEKLSAHVDAKSFLGELKSLALSIEAPQKVNELFKPK